MQRVLLVEDNVMNQEGFSRLLIKRGYEVIVANDGTTALTLYRDLKPDLILMDVSLPDIDGFEVTSVIRSIERESSLRPIPIIAITAHAMLQDRQRAKEAGCSDFEPKPMDFRRLFQKIDSFLALR